jgi:hypothetical protein
MPATREPSASKAQTDRAAARPHPPRLVAVRSGKQGSPGGIPS